MAYTNIERPSGQRIKDINDLSSEASTIDTLNTIASTIDTLGGLIDIFTKITKPTL